MSGVRGVALLPKKLERAKEETCPHLPPHHVRPLVDEEWQVAIALHPLREHRVDDRLRRRSHDEVFLELLPSSVRDDGRLRREALNVLRLLVQEALGNEEREVRVLMAGSLEHVIERALHALPNAVTRRTNHHAAAHR